MVASHASRVNVACAQARVVRRGPSDQDCQTIANASNSLERPREHGAPRRHTSPRTAGLNQGAGGRAPNGRTYMLRLRVLLADPDASLVARYRAYLTKEGFSVAAAHSSLECLERLGDEVEIR